jgi:pilus assembly protein CpaE
MTRQSELRSVPPFRTGAPPPGAVATAPESRSLRPASPPDQRRPSVTGPVQGRALPAVSIHAFCEASATAEAMQAAGADRRLAKALVEVSTGGIDAAVANCAADSAADRPASRALTILVVETSLPRPLMLARLDALAGRCDPATRLILIGQHNDIALYRELMRRGVGEYLIAPVSPAQLVDAVAGVCHTDDAAGGSAGSIIAFIGAKGGAGSSTVCHNVAWALSEALKSDVIVADLDLAFGTAGLDFNQEAVQGIAEALQAPERLTEAAIDRLLTKCSQHLSILAAPVALDRDYDISAGACGAVLDTLRQHAAFVAVDLPHLWTSWVKQVLVQTDEIVITAAPDLANLRNAKNLVDLLEASRPTGKPPRLVVNMAKRPRRQDIAIEDLSAALDLTPEVVIELDSETFALAATNGQMIEECSRKARAAQQFRTLAMTLAQRSEPKAAVRTSPLAPILDRLMLRA